MKILLPSFALLVLSMSCSPSPGESEFENLAADVWHELMAAYPEWSTYNGYVEHNDRWSDVSPEGFRSRREQFGQWRERLRALGRDRLPAAEQLSFDLLDDLLTEIVDAPERDRLLAGSGYGYTLFSQMEGVHQAVPTMLSLMPAEKIADYETMIRRLRAVGPYVEQTLETASEDLAAGVVLPRVILRDVPAQIEDLLADDPHASAILEPFQDFPASISDNERQRLRDEAAAVYVSDVAGALRSLRDFLTGTYIPGARETVALTELPGGSEWYAYKVRVFTTSEMGVEEIHELGRREVARIRAAMDDVIRETGFEGDFAAFSEFLRTDPRFYFTTAEALLTAYRDASKRADPELVSLFGRLPRLPYGVEPVPSYSEASQTTAYYTAGSIETGRPGTFFANTYNLASRPRWEIEALTLHEAVPGHHLQIALAQEMERVPEFRRHLGYNAYSEGWGLYAESLGYEMGFYEDPYSRFGQLTYEMWRAVRLVVDTGLHGLGWTRRQAIDFFLENASKSEHDITVEIDRYIAWPGQALGYKIGQLEIRRLRTQAEEGLGDRFDVRRFHDVVLGEGGLPLTILVRRVEDWIEAESKPSPER